MCYNTRHVTHQRGNKTILNKTANGNRTSLLMAKEMMKSVCNETLSNKMCVENGVIRFKCLELDTFAILRGLKDEF